MDKDLVFPIIAISPATHITEEWHANLLLEAGCIPVFVGPPFAAMPFHDDLIYPEFAINLLMAAHHNWTSSNSIHHVKASLQATPLRGVLVCACHVTVTGWPAMNSLH